MLCEVCCSSNYNDYVTHFSSTVAVAMKNVVFWDIKAHLYLTGNTLRLRYRGQLVNAMWDLRFSLRWLWRIPSSEMWRLVALVRTDVSKERITSIFRVMRIRELGTTLAVTSYRNTMLSNPISGLPSKEWQFTHRIHSTALWIIGGKWTHVGLHDGLGWMAVLSTAFIPPDQPHISPAHR
jgi:hypothetical protein